MKRIVKIGISFVILLSLLLTAAACSTPAAASTASPAAQSDSPAASPSAAADTASPTVQPTATAEPASSPAAPTASPSPTDFTVDAPAFKLYNLVKLGMTRDEADKATGQAGEAQSPSDQQNNIFTYTDDQGCGVRVTFNKQNMAYSKEVFYNDPASVLGPLNPKPVTHDEYDQISTSMTYTDVVSILGSDGVIGCVTADKDDCVSNPSFKRFWGNKDGSFIEVDFKPDGTIDTLSYNDYQPE